LEKKAYHQAKKKTIQTSMDAKLSFNGSGGLTQLNSLCSSRLILSNLRSLAKLHFREVGYQTSLLSPALTTYPREKQSVRNEKAGQTLFCETLSGELSFNIEF